MHIPVVLSESGLKEMVYNDFFIGEGSDVLIVAGCGIDNCGSQDSQHDGVAPLLCGAKTRTVPLRRKALRRSGDGAGKRLLNPGTEVHLDAGQQPWRWKWCRFGGVDSTIRTTTAELEAGARLGRPRTPDDPR